MKTTGQVLQEARLTRKLELDEVSKNTKIRINFLNKLEADDFSRLPNATVAKGFIRNYAQYLNLNPEQILAIFRRDFIENEQGQIVPRGFVDPVGRNSLWTPKTTIIASVFLVFTLFGSYLSYQFWLLKGPPTLSVMSPSDNTSTRSSTIEVIGITDPEATISVNNQLVTLDRGGEFFVRIPLQSGTNTINIEARGKSGKTSSITRSVFLTTEP
jgi:cytoskeletal protein RodZ